MFLVLVNSPNACDIWGWASPKTRTWTSIWVSHVSNRKPDLWVIICSFPSVHQQDVRAKVEVGLNPWHCPRWFNPPCYSGDLVWGPSFHLYRKLLTRFVIVLCLSRRRKAHRRWQGIRQWRLETVHEKIHLVGTGCGGLGLEFGGLEAGHVVSHFSFCCVSMHFF